VLEIIATSKAMLIIESRQKMAGQKFGEFAEKLLKTQ